MSKNDKAADARLRREFHITLDEYNRVLEFQGGKCAICRKRPVGRRLAVDHRHGDGLLRGLLCWTCNKFVIGFKDDALLFLAAYRYLMSPPMTAVIGTRNTAPGKVGTKKRKKLLKQWSAYRYLVAPPFVRVLGTYRFTAPGKTKTNGRAALLKQMKGVLD